MKQIKNFDSVKVSNGGSKKLPVGIYEAVVTFVDYKEYDWGNVLEVYWDVHAGDYKGFYAAMYAEDTSEDKKPKGKFRLYEPKDDGSEKDEWTKQKLKRFTNALEDSNKGYKWDWDEKKWKGLKFGAVVGEHETYIDGDHTIVFTELRFPVSIEDVKTGKVNIPDRFVDNKAKDFLANAEKQSSDGFLSVDAGPEEIPF